MSDLQPYAFETLETFKDIVENAHDLIHLVEPDGKIMYVNRAWEKLLGYSPEEIRGASIYSFVDAKVRDKFIAYRQNILQGRVTKTPITIGLVSEKGNTVYVEGAITLRTLNGKPLYTLGIFRDVTIRLQNEAEIKSINEEVREREANLQQLLFYAPDAVVAIDTGGHITYWNPKAELIFGWKSAEVIGKPLNALIIPPQYIKAHNEGMNRYLATGEARVLNRTMEITALDKAGREFYISLTISTTYRSGQIAFIAFIRDIDEDKRIAMELEQKRAQLEISNQELEQFAYVASHDMREPVRKVLVFSSLLQSDAANPLSQKSRNYVSKIERAASRLNQMIEGVLAYSSLKAEKPVIEKVNLNTVISNVETDLELVLQQKGGVIKYSNLPTIEGAPFLLFQLFYNLISNALKFSKRDVPPVVEITARRLSSPQHEDPSLSEGVVYAEIMVQDNGIGFAQEHAEIIFKTFSRLHRKDRFEGTGLGLSLCKSIVEKHHGLLRAFGTEHVGSTFVILLPERFTEKVME